MNKLQLSNNLQPNITVISNDFIDRYMLRADGEYVKIYLLLLRLMNQNAYEGPEQIADLLELTLKDVLRSFAYWEKEGLLTQEAAQNSLSGSNAAARPETAATEATPKEVSDAATARPLPVKSSMSPKELSSSITGSDLEQTIYMAEIYIGHPLSHNELETFYYIERQLQFSSELLEYLIEYCVTKGKKSIRYMESVAIYWYEHGIDTVQKAKEQSVAYTQNVFPIMKAFGISGRNPAPSEIDYINRWNAMGFDISILLEACNRTMLATHQASFPYASRILEEWKKQGVRTMKDIQHLDSNHRAKKPAAGGQNQAASPKTSNPFHNFDQRSYDFDDLEARLLDNQSHT